MTNAIREAQVTAPEHREPWPGQLYHGQPLPRHRRRIAVALALALALAAIVALLGVLARISPPSPCRDAW